MNRSETIGAIAAALAKAQAVMRNPAFDKQNSAYQGFRYASLAAHLDAIRNPLSMHGISVVQPTAVAEAGKVHVTTMLLHTSGEWIASEITMPCGNTATAVGSALTYARRYSLAALVGIVGEDDDDGNAATQAASEAKPNKKAPAKQVESGSASHLDSHHSHLALQPDQPEEFRILKVAQKTAKSGSPIWWVMLEDRNGATLKASTFSETNGAALQMAQGGRCTAVLKPVKDTDYFSIYSCEVKI